MLSEVQFANEEEKNAYAVKIRNELDPTTITAIVLGTCMSDSRLEEDITASTTKGSLKASNQYRLTEDVMIKDKRATRFIPIMTDGRKNAKEAIRDYIVNKNDAGIKKGLQTLADYTVNTAVDLKAGDTGNRNEWSKPQKLGVLLGNEIIEKKSFGVEINPQKEIGIITTESYKKQMRAMMESDIIKTSLVDNFAHLTQEQKESMVGDMLFNAYLSCMARVQLDDKKSELCRRAQASLLIDKILEKHGLDGKTIIDEDDIAGTIKALKPTGDLADIYIPEHLSKTRASDFDVILAGRNGEQQLKSLYMDSIRNSDIFKSIVNSKSKSELINEIMKADNIVHNGIVSIKDVKLPNASKDVNDRYQKAYDNGMKEFEEAIIKHALSYEEYTKGAAAKYGFTSLKPDAVKKNAENIKALYDIINGNNTWGGSENNNYKNMLSKMKELKDLSEKQAKHGQVLSETEAKEYMDLVHEVDRLADIYLENKKDINSDYAERRVEGVRNLRLALKANLLPMDEAVNSMKKETAQKLFGGIRKVYNETLIYGNPDAEKVFYGDKYKENKSSQHRSYSLVSSEGLSVAVFALAATGEYTLDDIMDPDKFKAEKAEMFDKVVTAMKSQTPENRKWIAETLYNGRKGAYKLLNDTAKSIDFLKPEIYKDEKFCKLNQFYALVQDAEQEMERCKDDLLPVIKEHEPDVQSWKDVKGIWSPLAVYRDAMKNYGESTVKLATERTGLAEHAANATSNYLMMNEALKELENLKKTHPDDPITAPDLASRQKLLTLGSGVAKDSIKRNYRFMDNDPKFAKNLAQEMVVGGFLKGVSLIPDNNAIDIKVDAVNFPTEEKLKAVAKNGAFLQKTDAAIKRLSEKEYTDKKEFVKDSAYAIFGQMYRLNNGGLPVDVKTGKEISLDQHVKNQIKNPAFLDLLKSSKKENAPKNPKQIAALAKNPEKLHQLMEESAQQYQNIKNQQSQKQKIHTNPKQSIHNTLGN